MHYMKWLEMIELKCIDKIEKSTVLPNEYVSIHDEVLANIYNLPSKSMTFIKEV